MTAPEVPLALGNHEELARRGFVLLHGTVPPAVVARLIEAIDAALSTADVRSPGVRNIATRVRAVRDMADSDPVRSLVRDCLGARGRLVRSVLFDKTPDVNWKVTWHQDLTISVAECRDVPGFGPWTVKDGVASVQPPAAILEDMVTVRVHLDDCGSENGPVRVVPGTHRRGRLAAEAIDELVSAGPIETCTCAAGDVLLMKPLILHASSPASLPGHRRVVHLDFSAGALPGGLEWSSTT